MKPKILLCANQKTQNYVDAVNGCGGEAEAFYCPEVLTDYDGLILCGGNDIDPKYYGEEINGSVNIDSRRDTAEFAVARAFLEAEKPILGICRGSQLINILLGGSMCQHIENANEHIATEFGDNRHIATAQRDSLCYRLYGEEFFINSAHHQAIKRLGEGLTATMHAGDIIEGFQHKTLPIIGVQWHPERMCFSQKRNDTVDGSRLFEAFIEMCKNS